jgi:hypothetical protein
VGDELRRGVVFINETVPYKWVAWVANKLYKEHYTAIPTRHQWSNTGNNLEITYEWNVNDVWNSMQVSASAEKEEMQAGSIEEFIFEHYYGYTQVDAEKSIEYKINHPSWRIHAIHKYNINCDFETFYGANFASLNHSTPHSIMLAEGSSISVNWKRIYF